tara:strand:- start:1817 stop:2353 length:537 start_codon:yes stop_codon:yes gene_type:complete
MTTQNEEFARIQSYLNAQGAKYSHPEIWERMIQTRLEFIATLKNVSAEQSKWKPSENEWSIGEIALHLLKSSRNIRTTVVRLSKELETHSENVEPPRELTNLTVDEFIKLFREDSIEWSSAIHSLPTVPPLEPTSDHSMFGELHARAWHMFQRLHDTDHMNQIKSVKESPDFPAKNDN